LENPVRSIADILLERGLISVESVTKANDLAKKEGAFLEDAFLALGVVSEIDLAKVAGEVYGLPYIDLSNKKIPFVILSRFPEDVARKYSMIVFEASSDQMLKVAISKPWDPVTKKALEFIKEKNHLTIDPYIVTGDDLNKVLEQYKKPVMLEKDSGLENTVQPTSESIKNEMVAAPINQEEKNRDPEEISALVKEDIISKEQLQEIIKNSTVPRAVAAIIKFGVYIGASDIHIEPMENEDTRIRYRIDGVLNQMATIPAKDHAAFLSRIKILSKLKIDEQRIPQDGRIDAVFGDKEIDLRISTLPVINGEKVVMRILDKSGGVLQLEDIGLAGKAFEDFTKAIKISNGIILVTGPTGSGKSTTLYAAISRINNGAVNIVTLEDPIEYQMKGVNQSQVKPYIGYSFAEGLRSILRQDPNIIMVGEIRDQETATMAIQSALTGHLVLSTLHTNSAAGALPRLIDMGIEPFLIGSSLHTVVAQRLVRKVCESCKIDVELSQAFYEDMKREFDRIPQQYREGLVFDDSHKIVKKGAGCQKCNGTGYKGRIGVFEVLRVSEPIQSLIVERASTNEILNKALEEGMITMKQDGVLKVIKGVTTMEEVYRATNL